VERLPADDFEAVNTVDADQTGKDGLDHLVPCYVQALELRRSGHLGLRLSR